MNTDPDLGLPPSFKIPNLCQTQTLLYLMLVSELLVLAWALVDQPFSWINYSIRAFTVLWITLLSTGGLCFLRPKLPRWTLLKGWLICFLWMQTVGTLVILVGHALLEPDKLNVMSILQQSVAIGLISAMLLRYFQLQQLVIDQSQAEIGARMDALQARIKPHFLFNSLNTIAELIVTRPIDAEKSVEHLASLFRANLKQKSSFCALSEEIALVKGYLALEQWRLDDRLKVNWNESIHDPEWPVPVLCLQPLVENAVVHGVASSAQGGEMTISVLQSPRITTMIVSNTVDADLDKHKGHGVGLKNIQGRLDVLYGQRARCRIEQSTHSYKITLTLPKDVKEDDQ